VDYLGSVPVHVVWEITLACNLKCQHCGSRAGRPRPGELTTAECLDVVEQLAVSAPARSR
jgi:MoaA/NifB/PqqE/SkfB family radical SAM enzyme